MLEFASNDSPTIGVEIELQLVDQQHYGLTSAIETILSQISDEQQLTIKPELMQSYLEINTGICNTVADVRADLREKLRDLESVTRPLGIDLFWGGTHPFSEWKDQDITQTERYLELVELMQDVARKLVTFGLHVHVGVDTGDKAILICERITRFLPLLLALSSNSPFWDARRTGLHSSRSKIMEALPTAGLPYRMRNWSEYVWLVRHLEETGFINSIREIWWDVRPHHNFGTVEVRICDVPANLDQVCTLTAMVQCLVEDLSRRIDRGTYDFSDHPMMVQQNKWRATRFGSDAQLVVEREGEQIQMNVPDLTESLVERLHPIARELDCVTELETARQLPQQTGAKQQIEVFERTGSGEAVVRELLDRNHWSRSEF